jgi:hypothetical protein
MIKLVTLILFTFLFISCENRDIKYAGLNDLAVGAQQIILYDNGEFYLELGAGGAKGTYEIKSDTVFLKYYEQPENWADKILMTESYFITINGDSLKAPIKIKR